MRSLLVLLRCALLLLCCTSAWAQKPNDITPGEWALAPEFCPDVQGFRYGDQYHNTSPRAGYWVSLMGDNFWHMHHHCWAVINLKRANAAGISASQRRALLIGAKNDFGYVIRNARPDFVMLPEIFTRMGDVQVLLGEHGGAMEAYQWARKLKPDYWPPYVRWAEVLDKIGKKKEALALVEQILRITPNDPIVQGHYKRLGGNPVAFVRNLPPAPVAAASAASAAETTADPAAVPGAAASAPAAAATAPAPAPALPGSAAKP